MLASPGLSGEAVTPTSIERVYDNRVRYLADIAALNLLFWDRQFRIAAEQAGISAGRAAVRVALDVAAAEVLRERLS